MQAMYEGTCGKCTRTIYLGQDIKRSGSGWVHARCPRSDEEAEQMALPPIDSEHLMVLGKIVKSNDPCRAVLHGVRYMTRHYPRTKNSALRAAS